VRGCIDKFETRRHHTLGTRHPSGSYRDKYRRDREIDILSGDDKGIVDPDVHATIVSSGRVGFHTMSDRRPSTSRESPSTIDASRS